MVEGGQALFQGLAAESRWDWNTQYPVLRLGFGGGVLGSVADLGQSLNEQLGTWEEKFALSPEYADARRRFKRPMKNGVRLEKRGQIAICFDRLPHNLTLHEDMDVRTWQEATG